MKSRSFRLACTSPLLSVALAVSGCLGPEVEALDASLASDRSLGVVEDAATGRSCGAVLVGPRVAVTAKTCLAGATADRLRFRLGETGWSSAGEWQYYRGADGSADAGGRFEDLQALLLADELPDDGLGLAWGLPDSPVPIEALARGGVRVPVEAVARPPDMLTGVACGLAAGDPVVQGGALVAVVSQAQLDCSFVATTVFGRGPILSALSKAEGHTSRLIQHHSVTDGRIDAESDVTVLADPARALAALQGDWSRWWIDGRVANHTVTPDGHVVFDLRPVRSMPTRVHVDIGAPRSVGGDGWGPARIVMDVTLSGHFAGPARLEIESVGMDDEPAVVVRSIWEGVVPTGAFAVAPGAVAQMHMWAEGGKLPGRRTGLPGLVDYLERWQDVR